MDIRETKLSDFPKGITAQEVFDMVHDDDYGITAFFVYVLGENLF